MVNGFAVLFVASCAIEKISSPTLSGIETEIGGNYGSARPRYDMPRLLALYKAGVLKLDELITRTDRFG